MQSTNRELLLATLEVAKSQGMITGNPAAGRLMSPEETRSALRGRTGPASRLGGWFACSDVHPDMHMTLGAATSKIPSALTQVHMGSGIECLMVLHQVDRWQHRFCIPLVGDTITRWLDSIRNGAPIQVSLAAESSGLAMLSQLVLSSSAASQLPRPMRALPADIDAFADEFLAVALWSALSGAMDVGPDLSAPERICLSLLMPPEIQAFGELLSHRHGGQASFEC